MNMNKNLVVPFLILGIFFNYTFNYSRFWFGFQINSIFLEITFGLCNLLVIILAFYHLLKLKNLRLRICLCLFLIFELVWILYQGYTQPAIRIWQFLIVFSQLFLWIFLLKKFWSLGVLTKFEKLVLVLIFVVYSLTDYFLLRDSQSLIFACLLCLGFEAKDNLKSIIQNCVVWFLGLNACLALYQFIFGKSLGLKYLGEVVTSVSDLISAKQEIFSFKILRGYGLTDHPVILGFLGVITLFILQTSLKHSLFNKYYRFLEIISVFLIIISFSRSAWLIAIFIYVLGYLQKLNFDWKKLSLKHVLLPVLGTFSLILLFVQRLFNSDIYRLQNLQLYIDIYNLMTPTQKLFGIGIGQYSLFLQHNQPSDFWSYTPIHNVLLLLLAELGLVGSVLLVILVVYFIKRRYARN